MRIANLSRRLVVITGPPGSETAHDAEKNSGGRFGPQPQAVFEEWDAFRAWAAAARWEGGSPVEKSAWDVSGPEESEGSEESE